MIGDTLIGANGEAIALAVVRALVGGSARESTQTAEREFERIREVRARRQGERAQSGDEPAPMLIGLQEAKRRWARMNPQIVVDIPRMPAEQMQVDELWATQVANGERQATLRIWDWGAPAVVCGKFQSIADEVDLEYAKEHGIEVVRRDTGGGAMFIEPQNTITYSLYVPEPVVAGLDARQCYQFCDMWLLEALAACGVRAHFAGLNDTERGGQDRRRGGTSVPGQRGGARLPAAPRHAGICDEHRAFAACAAPVEGEDVRQGGEIGEQTRRPDEFADVVHARADCRSHARDGLPFRCRREYNMKGSAFL